MKILNSFKDLTKFELVLWITSLIVVTVSFLLPEKKDYFTLVDSLIGVTALIFVAKGYVIGQVLTVVFGIIYGVISFFFQYYGEMITYLGMTSPIAVMAVVSWLRHPYKKTAEVEVNKLSKPQIALMLVLSAVVTFVFFFVLKALGTTNLLFSTISVTTSFIASFLTFMRSAYYGLGYAANDIVLIVLWTLAAFDDISYLPMVFCFVMFFANDFYGFINWRRIRKRQIN